MDNSKFISILKEYPYIWKDEKRFKAILMDIYPEDKAIRNLLIISVDEQIPVEMEQKKYVTELEYKRYGKRIENATGCNPVIASEIVNLWSDYFDKFKTELEEDEFPFVDYDMPTDYLELGTRSWHCLRRAGVNTIGELIERRHELSWMRSLGRKSFEEIGRKLENLEYDYVPFSRIYRSNETKLEDDNPKYDVLKMLYEHYGNMENEHMQVLTLEKAVLDGYKGDYSIIPLYYLNKMKEEKYQEKAFYWSYRWYHDFVCDDRLYMLDDAESSAILMGLSLMLLKGIDIQDNGEYKEALRVCLEKIISLSGEGSDPNLLYIVGMAFTYGKMIYDESSVDITVNPILGFEAFYKAMKLGDIQSTRELIRLYYYAGFIRCSEFGLNKSYMTLWEVYKYALEVDYDSTINNFLESTDGMKILDGKFESLMLPKKIVESMHQMGIETTECFIELLQSVDKEVDLELVAYVMAGTYRYWRESLCLD